MQRRVHDLKTGETRTVELTPAEIADIQQMQAEIAAREALPKPGEDLLALAIAAQGVNELQAVVIELVRRVFGLPVVEAAPEMFEAQNAEEIQFSRGFADDVTEDNPA